MIQQTGGLRYEDGAHGMTRPAFKAIGDFTSLEIDCHDSELGSDAEIDVDVAGVCAAGNERIRDQRNGD